MSKQFLVFLAIGLVAVAAGISLMLVGTKSSHLSLDGKVLKVRAIGTDEKSSIVVVDFRARNEAKVPFMIRDGVIKVIGADGKETGWGRRSRGRIWTGCSTTTSCWDRSSTK